MKNIIIAWWSGGITSAVACYLSLKIFKEVEIVFLDAKGNESEDTYRFMEDCKKLYNQDIITLSNPEYKTIQDVWRKYGYINNATGAICSTELKRAMREQYQNLEIHWGQVFGFEYEKRQIKRHLNMVRNYPEINVISPLIVNKINKADCATWIKSKSIELPESYRMGYENNNCLKTGCARGGIGYWQKRSRDFPKSFDEMANLEHELTDKKGEPVTICKDQSGVEKKYKPVFLKPHPDYPDIKDISMIKGKQPNPIIECFGFCNTID